MIGISKLYLGTQESSDELRYSRPLDRPSTFRPPISVEKKPVVVWNVTSRCNLSCKHCYACTQDPSGEELSHEEGRSLIKDLAAFRVPVLLFSGGEPLLRPDLYELIDYAVKLGVRCVLSTNGTCLNDVGARKLKRIGLSYAGISVDGLHETHDAFRQRDGVFEETLAGIRAARDAGLKVGLRFTILRDNMQDIPAILQLLRQEEVSRVCFYHLVQRGRGADLLEQTLTHEETRRVVDTIIDGASALWQDGYKTEVLTVDNHCDGPYLYLRMQSEKNPRSENVLDLLRLNGGNSTGVGIACVSWDGKVHPDQFWRSRVLGNVREQPFSGIWTDRSNTFLSALREKRSHVTGRCSHCRFLDVCGGNFRARAEALTGDPWASDPACYLSDQEIAHV